MKCLGEERDGDSVFQGGEAIDEVLDHRSHGALLTSVEVLIGRKEEGRLNRFKTRQDDLQEQQFESEVKR